MTVWVTGARGFIGRHVSKAYADAGHRVAGLGHGAWAEADHTRWGVADWRNGEVSAANLDAMTATLGPPDVVVHLAGGSAVGPSFAQPAEDFHRSVGAAAALADWMRLRAPGAAVVMASSAAVYGAAHAGPIAEGAVCTPFSPYGFHKRMAELLLESYARNFQLRVALVRFFSVYGPGLEKQLLWDACTRLNRQPEVLALGGTGNEVRDWLHVSDASRLIVLAGQAAGVHCPVLNGGTGLATPIRDVAMQLCESWPMRPPALTFSGVSRAGDPPTLVADVSAAQALGWRHQVDWRAGMHEYVQWFQSRHLPS